jgi:anti-sigma-K factor RskA
MQQLPHGSGAIGDQSDGRWAAALAATAIFMVGGGYLGFVGSAQADSTPGVAGSPGQDGQNVTCYRYTSQRDDASVCNVMAGDGEDGAPGAVDR